jgi:hypothetical protein
VCRWKVKAIGKEMMEIGYFSVCSTGQYYGFVLRGIFILALIGIHSGRIFL